MTGFAIRNDSRGYRAVGSEADVGVDEYFSLVVPSPWPPLAVIEIVLAEANTLVQEELDNFAKSRGWGNPPYIGSAMTNACSYVTSSNPAWAAEVQALITWRDNMWTWHFAKSASIENGTIPCPDTATIYMDDPLKPVPPEV